MDLNNKKIQSPPKKLILNTSNNSSFDIAQIKNLMELEKDEESIQGNIIINKSINDSENNNSQNISNYDEENIENNSNHSSEEVENNSMESEIISETEKRNKTKENKTPKTAIPDSETFTNFITIKDCSLIKYGIKSSTEAIEYGYCNTCDVNLIHPICKECLEKCHNNIGHQVKIIDKPDHIICACGVKLHQINYKDKKSDKMLSTECPYTDWCEKSGLSTLYVIDVKCVCEFCYRLCDLNEEGFPLEKEKEMLQICECEEINNGEQHTDLKKMYRNFEKLIQGKEKLILGKIEPLKFFNILFLGRYSYEALFFNFEETLKDFNNLNENSEFEIKETFLVTNFFLALKNFNLVLTKVTNTPIRYYSKNISLKINFNMVVKLMKFIKFEETPIIWKFYENILFFFRKVYLGNATRAMDKYKLYDFENMTPLQRRCISGSNQKFFPEAKHQINFFIDILTTFINYEITCVEAYDTLIQICAILERMSIFSLFNSKEMNKLCFSLEKGFEFFKREKSYQKQIQLFLIVIKMIHNFVYSFNDEVFVKYITSKDDKKKKTEPAKVTFLFTKNELGRLISRNVIRITYFTLLTIKNRILTDEEKKKCRKIMNHGMKIMSFLISPKDTFILSLNKYQKHSNEYLQLLFEKEYTENNETYKKIEKENAFLEQNYENFFIIEIEENELIINIAKSLENIISLAKVVEIRPFLFRTKYFFTISKAFYIIHLDDSNEEHKAFIYNYFTFLHYFVENNSDNAYLIFSHYILSAILKIPRSFALDIMRIFEYCSDTICKNDEIISNSKHIIKTLFYYFLSFKNDFYETDSKSSKHSVINGEDFIDDFMHLLLMIIEKLSLQTKQLNSRLIRKYVKQFIIELLSIFNLNTISTDNICLILILINKMFDSLENKDRKKIIELINFQVLLEDLDDLGIDLDYRTEILRFIKKFKYTIYFRDSLPTHNFNNSSTNNLPNYSYMRNSNLKQNTVAVKSSDGLLSFKKRKGKNSNKRKSTLNSISQGIGNDLNLIKIFIIGEDSYKNCEYINAFGQNGDNYIHIKNNPLIANYKFPAKYFTFYYYLNKQQFIDDEFKLNDAEEGLSLWEAEFKKLKDIYEKNSYDLPKFVRYYIKGIIIPLSAMIKIFFCYAHNCGGRKILIIYQILMKLLYVKNFLFEVSGLINDEGKSNVHFANFDLDNFLSDKSREQTAKDYFELKNRVKFSSFDYTELYEIFYNHFLHFIQKPKTLKLTEKFGYEDIESTKVSNIANEIEILNKPCEINKKKRKVLGIKKKPKFNLVKRNSSKIKHSDANQGPLLTENRFLTHPNDNDKNKDKINENSFNVKLEEIYMLYKRQKMDLNDGNSFYVSLHEMCAEFELNFRKLFLCLLINLSEEEEYLMECYLILYKLLLVETEETQNDIMANLGGKNSKELGFINNLSNQFYCLIIKLFIGDFNCEYEHYQSLQVLISNVIKVLRFLCQDHNNFFQEKILKHLGYDFIRFETCKMNMTLRTKFLAKVEEKNQNHLSGNQYMPFFNFAINVLHKILIITNRAKNEPHIQYYFDTQNCIVELLVEIIQGNKKEILITDGDKTKLDEFINSNTLFTFQNFVQIVNDILFDDTMTKSYCFKTRLLLMSFFVSILEEKTNIEIQKIIMKFLTVNKVLNSIIYTLKSYFYKETKNSEEYKEYYSNYTDKQIEQYLFDFDYTVYYFFKKRYFHSDMSKKSDEFKLANNYYRYIKLLSIKEKSPEAEEMIKQIDKISEEESKTKFVLFNKKAQNSNEIAPINLINEKERTINTEYIEHYFCIKFFEMITKVVEIRLVNERRLQKVIFTVPSDVIYLSTMTREEFINTVDRTNETTKKTELIKNIDLFKVEIHYFKNMKLNWFKKVILDLDFSWVQIIVYLYAVVFLIFMLFTLRGYTTFESLRDETRRNLRNLISINEKFTNAIDESIKEWGRIYDYITYIFCVMNGVLIICWLNVKLPLYYNLDKEKYSSENKIPIDKLTIFNKLYIIIVNSTYGRNYINTLLFMFIIALIGSIMKRGEIVYAFFLLAIVNLNPTLRGIASSIQVKKSELGSTFLLLIILVYFYSNIGFFFFNKNYSADIEDGYPNDNYCKTMQFCFLTNIDAGIRARGGAADQMVKISYERNQHNYFGRIVFDVSYFLICIIIMIDLVFGIILGTFSELREEERKHEIDRVNHCFICHETRASVEKKSEDFTKHREVRHNLWNYVVYMLSLKFSSVHNLNAVNSYARKNLDEKNISFLPSCKDNYNDDDGKDEVEENENEEIEEESEESNEFAEKDEEYDDDDEYNENEAEKKDDFDNLLVKDDEKNNNNTNNNNNNPNNNNTNPNNNSNNNNNNNANNNNTNKNNVNNNPNNNNNNNTNNNTNNNNNNNNLNSGNIIVKK